MPRWVSILVGFVVSPILGLVVYGASVKIVLNMMRTCQPYLTPGDSLIVLRLLVPAMLTIAATAITYTVVHQLIERDWSIYVAVAAAVLITPVMVIYSINSQYQPTPNSVCPNGTPPWWPQQLS